MQKGTLLSFAMSFFKFARRGLSAAPLTRERAAVEGALEDYAEMAPFKKGV